MEQVIPVGHEVPQQDCLFENGFNICNFGEARLRDVYLQHRELLGLPISSFDSRSQTFLFNKLVHSPGNDEGWKVELSNEGLSHLIRNGYRPQPGSPMHPAVADYLVAQQEVGIDTVRTSGRIISPPLPDPVTGPCRQWSDKAVYRFPCDAVSGTQVQRLAIGLETVSPTPPTATAVAIAAPQSEPQTTSFADPPLLFGAALFLAVIVAFVRSHAGRDSHGNRTI